MQKDRCYVKPVKVKEHIETMKWKNLKFICISVLLMNCELPQMKKVKTTPIYYLIVSASHKSCLHNGPTEFSAQSHMNGVCYLDSFLKSRAHSGCWHNLVPCSYRTDVLISWQLAKSYSHFLQATGYSCQESFQKIVADNVELSVKRPSYFNSLSLPLLLPMTQTTL